MSGWDSGTWDSALWDGVSWDVPTGKAFLQLKKRFKNIATPNKIFAGDSKLVAGVGDVRIAVFTEGWQRIKRRLEKV